MQKDFNTAEKKDNLLEAADRLQSSGTARKEKGTSDNFDWSPEASPIPKHRQNQIQKISKNEDSKEGDVVAYTDFDDMGLSDELLRGVYAYGYEKPSLVQQRAIVPCLSGRDVVAQAQSGTGKTATFSISLLQQIDVSKKFCQVSL